MRQSKERFTIEPRNVRPITVNQVGYPTEARKLAIFTDYEGSFQVVEEGSG
jgi:hypothetical protein